MSEGPGVSLNVQQAQVFGGTRDISPEEFKAMLGASNLRFETHLPPKDNTAGAATLIRDEHGNLRLDPDGPDPLNLKGAVIDVPKGQEEHLTFGFGGQPVLVQGGDALPIVGISIPGGKSFNLFESLGYDINELQKGALLNVPPEEQQVIAAKMAAAVEKAAADPKPAPLLSVRDMLQPEKAAQHQQRASSPYQSPPVSVTREESHTAEKAYMTQQQKADTSYSQSRQQLDPQHHQQQINQKSSHHLTPSQAPIQIQRTSSPTVQHSSTLPPQSMTSLRVASASHQSNSMPSRGSHPHPMEASHYSEAPVYQSPPPVYSVTSYGSISQPPHEQRQLPPPVVKHSVMSDANIVPDWPPTSMLEGGHHQSQAARIMQSPQLVHQTHLPNSFASPPPNVVQQKTIQQLPQQLSRPPRIRVESEMQTAREPVDLVPKHRKRSKSRRPKTRTTNHDLHQKTDLDKPQRKTSRNNRVACGADLFNYQNLASAALEFTTSWFTGGSKNNSPKQQRLKAWNGRNEEYRVELAKEGLDKAERRRLKKLKKQQKLLEAQKQIAAPPAQYERHPVATQTSMYFSKGGSFTHPESISQTRPPARYASPAPQMTSLPIHTVQRLATSPDQPLSQRHMIVSSPSKEHMASEARIPYESNRFLPGPSQAYNNEVTSHVASNQYVTSPANFVHHSSIHRDLTGMSHAHPVHLGSNEAPPTSARHLSSLTHLHQDVANEVHEAQRPKDLMPSVIDIGVDPTTTTDDHHAFHAREMQVPHDASDALAFGARDIAFGEKAKTVMRHPVTDDVGAPTSGVSIPTTVEGATILHPQLRLNKESGTLEVDPEAVLGLAEQLEVMKNASRPLDEQIQAKIAEHKAKHGEPQPTYTQVKLGENIEAQLQGIAAQGGDMIENLDDLSSHSSDDNKSPTSPKTEEPPAKTLIAGPVESRLFQLKSPQGMREVEMVVLSAEPQIHMYREFCNLEEIEQLLAIIQTTEALPDQPNNLLMSTELPMESSRLIRRVTGRICALSGIDENSIVAVCPSQVTQTAADSTKEYDAIFRIYLSEQLEGCESEFPFLGVSITPKQGCGILWQCRNERKIKLARAAHTEKAVPGASRVLLTAYIKH